MRPDRRVLGQPMRKLLLLRSCEVTTCLQLGCKFQRILGSSSGLAYHCLKAEEGQDVAERIQPLPIDHSRLCPIAHIYLQYAATRRRIGLGLVHCHSLELDMQQAKHTCTISATVALAASLGCGLGTRRHRDVSVRLRRSSCGHDLTYRHALLCAGAGKSRCQPHRALTGCRETMMLTNRKSGMRSAVANNFE